MPRNQYSFAACRVVLLRLAVAGVALSPLALAAQTAFEVAQLTVGPAGSGIGLRNDNRIEPFAATGLRARFGTNGDASFGLVPRRSALALQADFRFGTNWGVAGRFASTGGLFAAPLDGPPRLGAGRGDGFALGLTKGETWLQGDRISLTVSQPTRFSGGPLGTDSVREVPDYGGLGFRSGAREVMTELNYFAPLSKSMGLGLSLINRMRPNSDGQAPDERIMMMRFSTRF